MDVDWKAVLNGDPAERLKYLPRAMADLTKTVEDFKEHSGKAVGSIWADCAEFLLKLCHEEIARIEKELRAAERAD